MNFLLRDFFFEKLFKKNFKKFIEKKIPDKTSQKISSEKIIAKTLEKFYRNIIEQKFHRNTILRRHFEAKPQNHFFVAIESL